VVVPVAFEDYLKVLSVTVQALFRLESMSFGNLSGS